MFLGSLSGAGAFDTTNPASMNEVLRNYGDTIGAAPQYNSSNPFTSGFLNRQGSHHVYLSSLN